MLEDMIRSYEEAMEANDKKRMRMIEEQLRSVGMDRRSLLAIVHERSKENGKEA